MYDRNKYKFQHKATERTWNSFNAFVDVLFGDSAHSKINAEPTNDTEAFLEVCYIFFRKVNLNIEKLKPYKTCDSFVEQQEKLRESNSEKKKFEHSKTIKKVIKQVSKRLGFTELSKKKL